MVSGTTIWEVTITLGKGVVSGLDSYPPLSILFSDRPSKERVLKVLEAEVFSIENSKSILIRGQLGAALGIVEIVKRANWKSFEQEYFVAGSKVFLRQRHMEVVQ
jgi:hypothetical protein